MQATDLLILGIGSYILIKYGPQIAANFQQGQAAAPPPAAGGAPAPAPDATGAGAPAPAPDLTGSPITATPSAPSRFQGVDLLNPFTQNPTPSAPTPAPIQSRFPQGQPTSTAFTQNPDTSGCKTSAQDAACGFPGHPKCCANNTLLATPFQTVVGTGPSVSTRAPKKAIPPHKTSTGNPQCGGNPCGGSALVPTPGKCLEPTTGSLVSCTPTVSSKVVYANMTQVVNGKTITTIDPYFPAGFYLSQANYRSSLREPALH